MLIGDRIRKRREFLGMTQDELSQKVGYKSRSSINKIEMNENDIPQSKIVEIAKALDIKPSVLMFGSDEELEQTPQVVKFPSRFTEASEARKYLAMHTIFGSEGFNNSDIDKMVDDEVLEYANEVLKIMEALSYKYKK